MKLFTKSMEPNTTLGVAERVAYMSGNIGIALINTIVATFLMFFYTDVMMLNAGIIGTILMVSRLFDGVTDIIMGNDCRQDTFKIRKGKSMGNQNMYSVCNQRVTARLRTGWYDRACSVYLCIYYLQYL